MRCYEAIDTCPQSLHSKVRAKEPADKAMFGSLTGRISLGGIFEDRYTVLLQHISDYSALNLTYESDILNGILGLFRA